MALSVAVQFTVWTIYAQSSDRASDTANNIWNVLGWCQLAGLAMILVTTFKEKRRHDDDPLTSTRQWLTANRIFYSALLLILAFLPNWFAALGGAAGPKRFGDGLVHHRHRATRRLHSRGAPSLEIR